MTNQGIAFIAAAVVLVVWDEPDGNGDSSADMGDGDCPRRSVASNPAFDGGVGKAISRFVQAKTDDIEPP